MNNNYHIYSLGDAAATFDLGQIISEPQNEKVLSMLQWIRGNPFEGLKDILAAYSSLTVIYDPVKVIRYYHPSSTAFDWVKEQLIQAFNQAIVTENDNRHLMRIPVCYDPEYGKDLAEMAAIKQLSVENIIELHVSRTYRVYMMGFLPGFAYMGQVDERLEIPRKPQPEPVIAGSVGITGRQTGIYPLNSPGGWYIIGRTPRILFNKNAENPVLLHAGDQVQFYPITKPEFENALKAEITENQGS